MKKTYDLKRTLIVLFLSFFATICFAFSVNSFIAKAQTISPENAVITMQSGARVRLAGIKDGRNGIQWQLNMAADTYDKLDKDGVSFGILIAPNDYGVLDEDTVFAENGKFWWKDVDGVEQNKAENKQQIWNLETSELKVKDGVAYFNGSLVDINVANRSREFNAVGYMKYSNGNNGYEYKFTENNDTVRTMTQVALVYLESNLNELDDVDEAAFRAQNVEEKQVPVVINVGGTTETYPLNLGVSVTYTANDLAKRAGVSLNGYVKSAGVNDVKVTNATENVEINFESVETANLAGTYSLPNGTLKLEFDGTASVTKGETTTYGNWKTSFDNEQYSTVVMVATSAESDSMVANIEKTESAFALVEDGESYAQTASSVTTIYEAMLGTYKYYYKYSSTTEVYGTNIEITNLEDGTYNIKCNYNNGIFTVTPSADTFGTYTSSSASNAKGYYTKIDGKYYLFNQVTSNSLLHYGFFVQGGAGNRTDDTLEDEIYAKLAGNYSYSGDATATVGITTDLLTTSNNSNDKGLRYGNGRQVVAGSKVNTTVFGSALDLLLKSKTTGSLLFRSAANNGTATPSSGCPFFIVGDKVVFAENKIAGLILVKGETTTQATYLDAIRTYISGQYLGTNGFDLKLNADGTATLDGDEISYVVNPERTVGMSDTANPKSIYKGTIVLTLADGSAQSINYDFTYGRTILSSVTVDAMQIG